MFYKLSCDLCQKWLKQCQESPPREGLYTLSPPSWLLAWVILVYETLLSTPLEKSNHLFDALIMDKFEGRNYVCQDCLEDFMKWSKQRATFNQWAKRVKDVLAERLESVHHLYAL